MEKKIILPEGYELVESGNEYIVRKKGTRPKSWREFCKEHPIKPGEARIGRTDIMEVDTEETRVAEIDKDYCTSIQEAEAFLALIQLRQLRKAWVGDWKPSEEIYCAITIKVNNEIEIENYKQISKVLSFPTREMAEEFLECFKDLCETAKMLL